MNDTTSEIRKAGTEITTAIYTGELVFQPQHKDIHVFDSNGTLLVAEKDGSYHLGLERHTIVRSNKNGKSVWKIRTTPQDLGRTLVEYLDWDPSDELGLPPEIALGQDAYPSISLDDVGTFVAVTTAGLEHKMKTDRSPE